VAIACQGGGSHTAFTAGVLKRLFDSDDIARYEIVGLSGTSGGAVSALLAWSALSDGGPDGVGTRLERFWTENSASAPWQQLVNSWVVGTSSLQNVGAAPAVSPYHAPTVALDQFRGLLTHLVDFDRIEPDPQARLPMLLIGAVDVLSGDFRAFNSRRDRITPDTVLASAAIPNLFPAVPTDGGTYWDGLFSQNPPVRELLDTLPDEIWIIQINPKESTTEPRTVVEIADRRNELAGNLSLYWYLPSPATRKPRLTSADASSILLVVPRRLPSTGTRSGKNLARARRPAAGVAPGPGDPPRPRRSAGRGTSRRRCRRPGQVARRELTAGVIAGAGRHRRNTGPAACPRGLASTGQPLPTR
jgi:predicted acylesterase/phospholipase RssA